MNKQCECCLSLDNLMELNENLAFSILTCFSIEVSSSCSFDKSMNFICDECIHKIERCSEFRSQIVISQTKLKELYSSTTSNDGIEPRIDAKPNKLDIKSEPVFKEEILSDCEIDDSSIDRSNTFPIENSNVSNEQTFKYELPIEKKLFVETNHELNVESTEEENLPVLSLKRPIIFQGNSSVDTNQSDSEETDASIPKKIKKTSTDSTNNSELTSERRRQIRSYLMRLDGSALNCELCDEVFDEHRLLLLHIGTHYQIYVCDMCDKLFTKKRKLKKHMKNHEESKSPCSKCHKLIKPSYMSIHMKNHTEGFYFKCSHCTEKFPTYIMRLKHMNTVHKVDIYKYHCKVCPKKFYAPKNLNDHVDRCHLKKLNVACDVCGLKFFNKTDLNRHMRVHSDEKKHECQICNKKYKRMSHLKEHISIHNAVKFRCLYCDTEYAYKSYLIRHIKIKHSN